MQPSPLPWAACPDLLRMTGPALCRGRPIARPPHERGTSDGTRRAGIRIGRSRSHGDSQPHRPMQTKSRSSGTTADQVPGRLRRSTPVLEVAVLALADEDVDRDTASADSSSFCS